MLLCQLLSLASEALELIIEFFIFASTSPQQPASLPTGHCLISHGWSQSNLWE